MLTCKICGKKYRKGNFQKHLYEKGGIRKDHKLPDNFNKFGGECYFCGGGIHTFTYGEHSYAVMCLKCDFLYDED